jgi:hypothetical protein
MSYDYILVKGKPGGDIEAFAEQAAMEAHIGTAEFVKGTISRLFPSVRWEKGPELPAAMNIKTSSWFGLQGPAEFQLTVAPDEQVQMITMSHCERAEVEKVAKEFGLVVLDEQSLEQFGG